MTRAVRPAAFGGLAIPALDARPRIRKTGAISAMALVVLGAASFGAGVIHLAQGPAHVEELSALGLGFYVAAAFQVSWAAAAAAIIARGWMRFGGHPSSASARHVDVPDWLVVAGIAMNVAIVSAWLLSRIVGLPAGETPWTPEAVGRTDTVAVVLEALVVVGLATALRARPGIRLEGSRRRVAAAVVALLLIGSATTLALGGAEEGHTHPPGHDHAAAAAGARTG